MNYINAEQFQEQPKKVQEVLLKWWQPSIGDLFVWVKRKGEFENDLRKMECCNSENIVQMTSSFKGVDEGGRIPLLTEGQLREFIEDKTNCKISCSPSIEGKYYVGYDKYANNEDGDLKRLTYVNDILSGYWKVACKIAACQIAEEVANE